MVLGEGGRIEHHYLISVFGHILQKVEDVLVKQFGENGKTIIDEVNQYVKTNEPIDFDVEIVPLLRNGKEAPQQKVIDDVRNRLQKYFGLKIKEPKPAKK